MSNALAIAHVTQALALLIETNLPPDIDIAVKVEPRKPPADPPTEPTITVFLYQVTPNTSQRNTDLPTRAADGTLVRRAAAPLDLHYVISAYGEEAELVGQRLIGSVVRTLHEIPVLPKDIIELAGERAHLSGSNLAEAVQRVRFTPTVMDIDETSKLWGMLHQTPYTLSVVYQAALVFIDGREVPVPGKPVERPEVRVLPFGAPGAPVPPKLPEAGEQPGARPGSAEPRASGREADTSVAEAAPAKTPAKAPVKTAAKVPAKAAAKAPARGRRTATAKKAAAKSSAEETKDAGGRADGAEDTEN
ncbi:Pvc16 family protein [Streptomyces coeruleorubidus]|uniref:Pvc16 family protein n=1 Tax=Streptomyces coeruleorubidus TaxID=116188 RepID=UPI00380DE252